MSTQETKALSCAIAALLACTAGTAGAADWHFDPKITLNAQSEDNHRLTDVPGQEVSVFGAELDALLSMRAEAPRGYFRLIPRVRSTLYPGDEDEETNSQYLRMDMERRGERSQAGLEASFARMETLGRFFPDADVDDDDDPGDPDPGDDISRQTEPNTRDQFDFGPKIAFDMTERLALELDAGYQDVSYDEQVADEREDYSSVGGSVGLRFRTSPTRSIAIRAGTFSYEPDDGISTDSQAVNVEWLNQASETSQVFVRGGANRVESFDELGNSDWNTGFTGGAGVRWSFEVTEVFFDLNRYMDPNASGRIVERDQLRLELRRLLSPLTTISFNARGIRDGKTDANDLFQERVYATAGVGFAWRMTQKFTLGGGYQYRWREYDGDPNDAASNELFLGITYEPTQTLSRAREKMETQHTASLGEYVAVLRRRRRLMVAVALPIVIVAVILAITLPNIYRSAANFLLVTDSVSDPAGSSGEFADQYVLSLADRVVSGSNLGRIVQEIDPYPEFGDDQGSAVTELRDNVTVLMTTQTILEPGGGRERTVNTGFSVAYDHPVPEKSQQVASALARIFVEQSRTERLAAARGKIDFFKKEGERTRDEIAEFESQLADFKERNFDQLPETAQANITIRGRVEQEMDSVDREIRGLQQNRVFVEQQLRQAQAGPTVNNLATLESEYASKSAIYAENHPDLVTLRRQIESLRAVGPGTGGNTLQAQLASQRAALAEARQRYSEDHPDIRRMMGNISSLEARIAAGESPTTNLAGESLAAVQLQTQLNAMNTQLSGLQGRSGQLRSRLEQFESRLGSTPEVEREYQAITRGLGTARAQFDQMVERRMTAEVEAAAISGGAADRFVMTGEPSLPWEPDSPKRLAIVIIGLILAAILALSTAVAAEAFDSRVRGGGDVRRTMGHSPLATVPQIHNSVYFNLRARRIVRLAVSMLVVTPVLYFLVHFMVN